MSKGQDYGVIFCNDYSSVVVLDQQNNVENTEFMFFDANLPIARYTA